MNFLSHFYFDRKSADSYHIIGTVLPDLLKNADKTINIHPEKLGGHADPKVTSVIEGWQKHLEIDRYFHSSEYFIYHSHHLKLELLPGIVGSPVKPFFLGHVALELILDNLLITTGKIDIDEFYRHIEAAEDQVIHDFLTFSGVKNTTVFFTFLDDFKKSGYLHTYADTSQIAYALKQISKRIWLNPFTATHEEQMNRALVSYREVLLPGFMTIFDEIDAHLA